MKKMGKVCLLALAAVLVLSFFGCKAMDESVDEHVQGEDKYEHIWEGEYEGKEYIRSALQFGKGTNDKLDGAKVTVDMTYPQYGKAGVIFGLNSKEGEEDANGDKVTMYNYYVVAVGEKQDGSGNLEYYIDYCTGMTSLSGGNSASATISDGKQEEIVENTLLGGTHAANEAAKFDIEIKFTDDDEEDNCDGTYTVKITYGSTTKEHSINHKDYGYVNAVATYPAQGTIASYGMLSGQYEEKKVDTTWTVDKDSVPSTLSADAE